MPKDLPGLYWDAERNRYFPITSRPAGPTLSQADAKARENFQGTRGKKRKLNEKAPAAHDASASRRVDEDDGPSLTLQIGESSKRSVAHAKRKVHLSTLGQSSAAQLPWDWTRRERNLRTMQLSHIGATSRLSYNHAPTFGKITTFCTYSHPHEPNSDTSGRWNLLGDGRGWLFRCKASYRDHDIEEPSRTDSDVDVELNWLPWSAELNLQPNGSISSISMWGSRWVATGAGSSARFASSDITSLDRMFIVTLPGARDLWASDIRDKSVAFGASLRAIYIPDIIHSASPEQLNTHSDVFTIAQDQNLIYTGARNGSIHRFDKRVGFKSKGALLLDSRFNGPHQRSSVLNLFLLGALHDDPAHSSAPSFSRAMESGLFVSQMNGQLRTYDLRFVTRDAGGAGMRGNQPVVIYDGHVNTHTRELGLAIDPTNDLLFAAGQDCRIRGWSLSSGEPIISPLHPQNISSSSSSSSLSILTSESLSSFPTLASSSTPRSSTTTTQLQTFPTPPSRWTHLNPFVTTFQDPVPVLRTSLEDSGLGGKRWGLGLPCLWGANGEDLWRWNLGQRGSLTGAGGSMR